MDSIKFCLKCNLSVYSSLIIKFYWTLHLFLCLEDLFPPVISVNTGLEVKEKNTACINSQMLAAIDEHQKDKDLLFSLTSLPTYGYLEKKTDIGKPITSFFMSDLNAGQVCYVHKSERHNFKDNFIFTVSDGKNYVSFFILYLFIR